MCKLSYTQKLSKTSSIVNNFQLKMSHFVNSLIETDEKVDIEQELNKIHKSIVKGVDATDRASTAMSTSTSTSKASSPYVVGSNDR